MKVQLEKAYDMPGPAAAAWAVLGDIERVAACMPGARITEKVDEQHYKGTVAVKFGPANMSFRGEVEVAAYDAAAQTVRLIGKGTDTTGGSGASMDITARIVAVDGAASQLVGKSEVSMSGKAAAFGNRLAGGVAEQVLKQFAANFALQVQAVVEQAATAAAATPGAPVTSPVSAPESGASAASAPAQPLPMTPTPQTPPLQKTAPAAELNGLALGWAVFKDWLRSLLSARKA